MIKIIKAYKNSRTLETDNFRIIGFGIKNDNKVDILRFEFDEFVDGTAELLTDLKGSDGLLLPFPLKKNIQNNSYDLIITKELLTKSELKIQLQISNEDEVVWHSRIILMTVDECLDIGTGEMPSIVENWLIDADIKLSLIENEEEIRVKNEEARVNSEKTRNENEESRINAETERKKYINDLKQDVESGEFDGATFKPNVNENGDLSWTNDKNLENPETVNIKGPKGDIGDSLFATFDIDLQTGELIMNKPTQLTQIDFELNLNGELEVITNV